MSEELDNDLSQESIREEKQKEKLQLEIDKLNNENKELTKSWWKKPRIIIAGIAAISPILLGLGTLWVARDSGFLQAQAKLNEIQKLTFEQEKQKNQKVIDSLNETMLLNSVREKILIKSLDSLKSVGAIAKQKLDSFLNDKRGVSEKVLSVIKENGVLQDDVKKLNGIINGFSEREKLYKSIVDSLAHSSESITIPSSNYARFYPNPVADFATIEINTISIRNVSMIIANMSGKVLYAKEINIKYFHQNENLDLRFLQKGSYLLYIQFANGEKTSIKLIKS